MESYALPDNINLFTQVFELEMKLEESGCRPATEFFFLVPPGHRRRTGESVTHEAVKDCRSAQAYLM